MNDQIYYHKALVCKNGHLISGNKSRISDQSIQYCPQCGQSCIDACPTCGAPIHGDTYGKRSVYALCRTGDIWDDSGISYRNVPTECEDYEIGRCDVPAYCHACGSPYPWTETLLDEASKIVDLIDELTAEQKEELKQCFPDLIAETPRSSRSSLVAAKLIRLSSSLAQGALQNLFIDHLTPFVLSLLNWKS